VDRGVKSAATRRPRSSAARRWFVWALAGVTLIATATIGWGAWMLAAEIEDGTLPAGVTVAGVDIGGMDRDTASAVVEEAVQPRLDRSIEVTFGEDSWSIRAEDAGAVSDGVDTVAAAYRAAERLSWLDLARVRWLGEGAGIDRDVAVDLPREAVEQFIGRVAEQVDREAVDAHLDWSSGWIEIIDAREGRSVVQEDAVEAVHEALLSDGPSDGSPTEVELPVLALEPEVHRDAYEQVILVRQGERRVHLYEDGEAVRSWPVAIGRAGSSTPTGTFTVGAMRHSPTWVNPDPTGWGSDMPDRIGPGPNNPLGLRAINWNNADGHDTLIRFHGTSNTGSIGTAASQGCVRMTNSAVIELFNRVSPGAHIVSVG
jgi:hypothetical protein